jgi:hypothetical protein
MKTMIFAAAILLIAASTTTEAASTRAEARRQCTTETKPLKGVEKRDAMRACMAKNAPAKRPSVQNERMKNCSADFRASGKPSSERRAYMRACLAKR